MNWYELTILTTQIASDAVCEMLKETGSKGISELDPFEIRFINENPGEFNTPDFNGFDEDFLKDLGDDVVIKAYYNSEVDIKKLEGIVEEKLEAINEFLPVGKGFKSIKEVDEEDWSTSWKKYYSPIEVTQRIVIKPTWEEYKASPDQIIVQLDPGMAFGTGSHETTQLCIEQLENYVNEDSEILDIGCGSGILSITSMLLGAKNVDAIDVDSKAAQVAIENFKVNNIDENRYNVYAGNILDASQKQITKKYDIIFANIIADVIISLNNKINDFINDDTIYIMSGIIKARFDDVVESLRINNLLVIEASFKGDWCCIVAKREN